MHALPGQFQGPDTQLLVACVEPHIAFNISLISTNLPILTYPPISSPMLPAITRSLPQSIGRICQARAWLCSTSGPSAVPAWSRGTRPTLIPNQLVLIRHGESTGNVDDHVYEHTPDWRVPLTTRGQEQAHASGLGLYYKLHPDGALHVYVSPYERTWQTWEHLWRGVVEAAGQAGTAVPRIAHIREDPRLAELSFGNFQVQQVVAQAKQERNQFGRFFYRMPSGESGLEVYERMGSLTVCDATRPWCAVVCANTCCAWHTGHVLGITGHALPRPWHRQQQLATGYDLTGDPWLSLAHVLDAVLSMASARV